MEKEQIKSLSGQLGCPEVYKDFNSRISMLSGDTTRISVTGNINTGKSSLINALADTKLEVSFLPTGKTNRVVAKEKASDSSAVESESEWLRSQQLELWEFPIKEMENSLNSFGLHYVHTDLCVFLTNAQSVLTRDEMSHLDFLEQVGIPTLVVLTKADFLEESSLAEVCSYAKNIIARRKYKSIMLLGDMKGVPVFLLADSVKNAVNAILRNNDVKKKSRMALRRLFEACAITQLFESCTKRMQEIDDKVKKVEDLAIEKENNLSDSLMDWGLLQNKLNERRKETSDKISDSLEKKRTDVIRQLTHSVEMSNDVKLFWEKELPYKLEDIMRNNSQTSMHTINTDVVNTINWLNGEIRRTFHTGLSTLQPISCTIDSTSMPNSPNPELADNKNMRIVARVGTAATVIAAATMLAPLGIGGVVMAVSMMAGVGAEFFMNKKQGEAKQKVIELIPNVVDQAQNKLLVDVSDNLYNVYSELVRNLQSFQQQWREEAEKELQNENSVALFNCKKEKEKWEGLMVEINSLSEEILNNK